MVTIDEYQSMASQVQREFIDTAWQVATADEVDAVGAVRREMPGPIADRFRLPAR